MDIITTNDRTANRQENSDWKETHIKLNGTFVCKVGFVAC